MFANVHINVGPKNNLHKDKRMVIHSFFLVPHQWLTGSVLDAGRQELQGSNPVALVGLSI